MPAYFSAFFHKLSPAELERLAILAEEASELAAMAMKIVRHGYESYNPDEPDAGSNRLQLMREYEQVVGTWNAMAQAGDVQSVWPGSADAAWLAKLRYTHHQGKGK